MLGLAEHPPGVPGLPLLPMNTYGGFPQMPFQSTHPNQMNIGTGQQQPQPQSSQNPPQPTHQMPMVQINVQ